MSSGIRLNMKAFSESVQEYLRASGYSQTELADALGLHPKVLSRKLNGNGNAYLKHTEVQYIIKTLVRWHVITTQDEALHLLEEAQVESTIFSEDEWGTSPLSALIIKRARPTSSSGSSQPTALKHNLPAPATRLIGRAWAVTRLQHLLARDDVRLVTLVGPGGSGKTRLALHLTSELIDSFAQGVWFVALAGIRDAALLPMSIMQALHISSTPGIPPLQSLIAYLQNKHLLLVLDNVEQVAEVTAIVDELLRAAPGLKMLITSRVVLRLYGEHEFSVPPLDLPDPGVTTRAAELAHYAAIQLFVERAQAVMPEFALTDENAAIIGQICARVDGLPLTLELAAARVKVLPPALLLERLSRARLSLLTGGAKNLPDRQQTLRNTITWSYNLLSSSEQMWFRRLGVFTRGWSLEAAEAMMQEGATAPESNSPLDMLEQLVNNSLLVRLPVTASQMRFTMLETLREYALEQLTTQGEVERLRDWHACYYLREAEAAEIGLRGPQQLAWLARLTIDRDNFRAALQWSLQRAREGGRICTVPFFIHEPNEERTAMAGMRILDSRGSAGNGLLAVELCLRLAAAFRPYWEWQGYLAEGRNWLGAALAVPLAGRAEQSVLAARAKALSEAARLVCLQNDQARAAELAEESIALWKQLDDARGLATALLHRGWVAHAMRDYETAKRVYQEGIELLPPTEDAWLYAQLLFYLGAALGFTSDYEQMRSYYAQSRQLFEQVGDKSAIADVWKDQGGMSILESKYPEAIDCLLKSIRLCYELHHKQFIATGIGLLSFAVGMMSEPDEIRASLCSARLGGAAEGLMDTIGLTPWTRTDPLVYAVRQHIRSRVHEHDWQEAWATGKALMLEQAIELAYRLGEEEHPG